MTLQDRLRDRLQE